MPERWIRRVVGQVDGPADCDNCILSKGRKITVQIEYTNGDVEESWTEALCKKRGEEADLQFPDAVRRDRAEYLAGAGMCRRTITKVE